MGWLTGSVYVVTAGRDNWADGGRRLRAGGRVQGSAIRRRRDKRSECRGGGGGKSSGRQQLQLHVEIKHRGGNRRWLKYTNLLPQNRNHLLLSLVDLVSNKGVWVMWPCLWTYTPEKTLLLEEEKQWRCTSLTSGRSSSQTHTLHSCRVHLSFSPKSSHPPHDCCHKRFLISILSSPFGCSTLKWIFSSIYCHFLGPNCRLIIIQYWQELEDELIQFWWPNIISGILSNPGGIFMKCHTVLYYPHRPP